MASNTVAENQLYLPIDEVDKGDRLCRQLIAILDCAMIADEDNELSPGSVHHALEHCIGIVDDLKSLINSRAPTAVSV